MDVIAPDLDRLAALLVRLLAEHWRGTAEPRRRAARALILDLLDARVRTLLDNPVSQAVDSGL